MPSIHIDWSDDFARIEQKLDRVLTALGTVLTLEAQQMADLSALQSEVEQNGDVVQSAVALIGGLAQQIRDLSTDPAALQALADQLDAQNQTLADAVAANTPATGGGAPEAPPGEPAPENP